MPGDGPIYSDDPQAPSEPPLPDHATMYAPMEDNGFSIPAVPYEQIDPRFLRQIVRPCRIAVAQPPQLRPHKTLMTP